MQDSDVLNLSNFKPMKLGYLSSVANHQMRKVIDINILLV